MLPVFAALSAAKLLQKCCKIGTSHSTTGPTSARKKSKPVLITYTLGSHVTAHAGKWTVEQLLTPETLANLLGIAKQTIYNRHSVGGDLPRVTKLGKLLRFRPSDVEAWLEQKLESDHHRSPAAALPDQPPPAPRRRGRPTKAEHVAARRAAH
ncbi:helix-turn-helix domain-containing protein [Thauera sp. 28]